MRSSLGLRLLSVQPVTQFGFTLHFWAYTDETPPSPDLESVGNREWLWQIQPYTTLEFQHVEGLKPTSITSAPVMPGWKLTDSQAMLSKG